MTDAREHRSLLVLKIKRVAGMELARADSLADEAAGVAGEVEALRTGVRFVDQVKKEREYGIAFRSRH